MKKRIKAALGFVAYSIGLHRRLLGDSAVVVAFHRVTNAQQGSALNCPVDVFSGLCRFFSRHFSVIPLSEMVARVRQNEPLGGRLCITFDDGYRDNYRVAAPVLRDLGLPATFFVATNFIGSDVVPEWDAADGYSSEWMSWEEVGKLAKMGFDIGGHTMNHADLGSVSHDRAVEEIAGCRQRLESVLQIRPAHFAYPFGGERNITPETARLVADSGFDCCLSCHGGVITAGDDPFELHREPINAWIASPYQFGFELLAKAQEENR